MVALTFDPSISEVDRGKAEGHSPPQLHSDLGPAWATWNLVRGSGGGKKKKIMKLFCTLTQKIINKISKLVHASHWLLGLWPLTKKSTSVIRWWQFLILTLFPHLCGLVSSLHSSLKAQMKSRQFTQVWAFPYPLSHRSYKWSLIQRSNDFRCESYNTDINKRKKETKLKAFISLSIRD